MTDFNRDCVILTADGTMEQVVKGLLERPDFYTLSNMRQFRFDVLVDRERNDSGVFTRGAELLKPFCYSHERALLMLDAAWEGAKRPADIRKKLRRRMEVTWPAERLEVVVLDPELEAWFWQEHPVVEQVLAYPRLREKGEPLTLRAWLERAGHWPAKRTKPPDPKAALVWALRQTRVNFSSALHGEVARRAPFQDCQDPAFRSFVGALQRWFPAETGLVSGAAIRCH